MTSQVSTATNNSIMKTTSVITSPLYPVLSVRNAHPRDKNIKFEEEGHKYTIYGKSDYTSVTTWVHTHFAHFDADLIISRMMSGKAWKPGHKYWGLTAAGIKDLWDLKRDSASGAGTQLHYEIECFMNSNVLMFDYTHKELLQQHNILIKYDKRYLDFGIEWTYFMKFVSDFPELKPFRTEWTVYHEEFKLAGSIDMVYENPDGTLSIYDWKRSAEINQVNAWDKRALTKEIDWMPDTNFWHYSIQLNTYKLIIERNYGYTVRGMYLVCIHPELDTNYQIHEVDPMNMTPLIEYNK